MISSRLLVTAARYAAGAWVERFAAVLALLHSFASSTTVVEATSVELESTSVHRLANNHLRTAPSGTTVARAVTGTARTAEARTASRLPAEADATGTEIDAEVSVYSRAVYVVESIVCECRHCGYEGESNEKRFEHVRFPFSE